MTILNANLITDELIARIKTIAGEPDFPFSISTVERGKFYEDLPDDVVLPVATVVPANSDPELGQQMATSAKRVRQYQVEVMFNFDDYPGRERDEVMTQVEWSLGQALGGLHSARALGGKALSMSLGSVEYGWPGVGHAVASLSAIIAVTYIEQYQ